ncbi:MAG: multi-sensor signal transduction multi-kinase, partial [Devosia sp.]|uniref:GAF domain-containing sensor histidine kinase n=1 Tax=Devosia sp. TaxID=1871048 RepID=UPI00260C331B
LRAGRKAKASAAYASANLFFAAGMALLDEGDWDSQYALTFSLWLECAECEFLTGGLDRAEHLLAELLQRGLSKVDQAAAYTLKVLLHSAKSENMQAVTGALTCLRLFGIDIPVRPTLQHVQAEYETVWQTLDGRPIEHLIDLPMMTDLELQTAMQLLSALLDAAYHTDLNLYCLLVCRMANVSTQHGMSGASAQAYAGLGQILGPVFHRYRDAQRFAKLACDMVEKRGFIAYQANVYFSMGNVALWTQPFATAIDFLRATFRTATQTGDLTSACYSMDHIVTILLLRNDPLDAVWRESEKSLDFVEKARFREVAAVIVSQQRFIATMQGRTATFSTFSDPQFDEQAFEAELTGKRTATTICLYWILKLKARFLSGDYVEALAAAGKAKALLWATTFHVQLLDYFYYTALTVAALYEKGSADEQSVWRDLLTAHRERLHEWADNNPPTFADKHSLVLAEIARLEGRVADAMGLYEHAIQSARQHGFVQNEGLAHELAARFYAARGFETIAHAYLRNARSCYLRWGALGKVRQLEQLHPHLFEESAPPPSTATFGTPVEQLDVGTVVKASQAVSGEIELGKLIETLMRIALEHAGAERGMLILLRGDEPQIAAEATTGHGKVEVTVQRAAVLASALPQSALHYVIRTRESVVLDDAAVGNLYSDDEYIRQRHPRSVLCLPIVKQAKLVGALYLENNLTPGAFTASRVAVLELLASQAAISLENAGLYTDVQRENTERKRAEEDLRRSKAYLTEAQSLSRTGSFGWSVATGEIIWSDETFRIFGYDKAPSVATDMVVQRTHPGDRAAVQQTIDRAARDGKDFDHAYRLLLPDGSVKHVHAVAKAITDVSGSTEFVGAVTDVTAARLAEDELYKAQAELLHVTRITTLGELAASIAHEVNQPLAAIVTNGEVSLRLLDREPPDLVEVRGAIGATISDGRRASEIISRLRALSRKAESDKVALSINDTIEEVIPLVQGQVNGHRAALHLQLTPAPAVLGDRVQLQQVIINLIVNAVEAMDPVTDRPRDVLVRSRPEGAGQVLVAVEDSGIGIDPDDASRLFNAFYSTKPSGMGMGLSICQSIIENHGGRLWASSNAGPGATFQFTLPTHQETGGGPR